MSRRHPTALPTTALALLISCGICSPAAAQQAEDDVQLDQVLLTAEQQIKQALGTSTITAGDLEKSPVARDISEIIRRQPGVNLTGGSASGQRGNQRQIDLRGMGPENTLILIDGKPVTSRNAVRMGRQNERDTRGDTSWVPPELVESIEIIRGPAAARYGSGASGGVVNIITKRPEAFTGSVGLHFDLPENNKEGRKARANAMIAGPINSDLSFRLFANTSKSDPDALDLNVTEPEGTAPAGAEGVVSKDVGVLLSWKPSDEDVVDLEFGFSRQGNRYAGDRQTGSSVIEELDGASALGAETNRMYRQTAGVTHRGNYAFGQSFSFLQFENTRNNRRAEGPGGSGEGNIQDTGYWKYITYKSLSGKTEWNLPGTAFNRDVMFTLGGEFRYEKNSDAVEDPRYTPEFRGGEYDSQLTLGAFAEANFNWTNQLTITPGMRIDHSDRYGFNGSPSLNATYAFNDQWEMKLGIARAFKAPSLFQMNPDYFYSSNGNGCPAGVERPCYIRGNPDLKPEYSINKEIGIAYTGDDGTSGSLTYFDNDYRNKIMGDIFGIQGTATAPDTLQWVNVPKARVAGLEGNFNTRFSDTLGVNINVTKMLKSENKINGNPLSLVPKHTINASLDWQARDNLALVFGAAHFGRIDPVQYTTAKNEPIPESERVSRGSYTLFSLSAKWDATPTVRVSAGINNLFDKDIKRTSSGGSNANTFNEPGRSFFLGVNKTF